MSQFLAAGFGLPIKPTLLSHEQRLPARLHALERREQTSRKESTQYVTSCNCMYHAAGFVGVIPALNKLTPEENPPDGSYHFSQLQLIVWSMTLAFFGVFVAIPLRTQVYPSLSIKARTYLLSYLVPLFNVLCRGCVLLTALALFPSMLRDLCQTIHLSRTCISRLYVLHQCYTC